MIWLNRNFVFVLVMIALVACQSTTASIDPKPESITGDEQLAIADRYYKSRNFPKAFEWYQHAADSGLMKGDIFVGIILQGGRTVSPDLEEAKRRFQKVADAGVNGGMIALSDTYLYGKGVTPSSAQAYFWAKLAIKWGPQDPRAKALPRKLLSDAAIGMPPEELREIDEKVEAWRPPNPKN